MTKKQLYQILTTLIISISIAHAQEILVVRNCPTVAQVIHSYTALTELSKLINETSLNKLLDDEDLEITFFAPVNYAFTKHYTATVEETAKTPMALEETMRMHITPKPITLKELETDLTFKTNSTLGEAVELTVSISDVDILILSQGSTAAVVDGDLVACKSVIHFVNSVLVLPRPILLLFDSLQAGLLGSIPLPLP